MSDTVRTGVAHFVITGEAMTEIARDMLLSDMSGQAYRIVADGLIGDGAMEAALSVLKGTHDLTGDSTNGLELVEAEDNEALRGFLANYRYIYAGRQRHQGAWRRPVAVVRMFGPDDAREATRYEVDGTPEWARARAMYYAGEGGTVEALELPEGKRWIIWEPCGEMPHWVKPNITAQEALDEALDAGRTLDERRAELIKVPDIKTAVAEMEAGADEDWEERRERQREERLREIGEKVRAQAGDDTFELTLKDGRKLTVPRAPFTRWALHRTDQKDKAPDWENVASSGIKMQLDNPDHTDWVLGSGLTLEESYSDNVTEAAWDAAFEFQEQARQQPEQQYPGIMAAMELLNNTIHEAATVVNAGVRTGIVGVDIAVFPDSQGSRVNQLGQSIGAIVEKGGKLAHFAIVTKGRGITVMRHPDACELFLEGTRVSLNPTIGRIIVDDDE